MYDKRRGAPGSSPETCGRDMNETDRLHQEQALDEALMESFPASDPVAISFGCVTNRPKTGAQTSPP